MRRVAETELERDAAEHQRQQHDEDREIERRDDDGEGERKRGQEPEAAQHQPSLVAVPDRRGGVHHDDAWINWNFNEFGWLSDNTTLWYLSEESGYSQLYVDNGRPKPLTSGAWEASQPQLSADGKRFVFVCNRASPGDYEVCDVPVGGGAVRELTALDGVEGFALSPDGRSLLVEHSAPYLPTQLAVLDADGGTARELTDTRTAAFKAIDWIQPTFVRVPSKHAAVIQDHPRQFVLVGDGFQRLLVRGGLSCRRLHERR